MPDAANALSASAQPRDRSGQWAETRRAEPGISLPDGSHEGAHDRAFFDDPDWADGSVLYPPRFTTADEVVEFYSNVSLPDDLLAQADFTYRRFHQVGSSREWAETSWDAWGQHETDGVDKEAWIAERTAQMAARPARLDPPDLRPIVRACAMQHAARGLPEHEKSRVLDEHRILVAGSPMTVRAIIRGTGMSAVGHHFLDRANWQPEPELGAQNIARERRAEIAKAVKVDLDRQTEQIGRTTTAVGNAVIDNVNEKVVDDGYKTREHVTANTRATIDSVKLYTAPTKKDIERRLGKKK